MSRTYKDRLIDRDVWESWHQFCVWYRGQGRMFRQRPWPVSSTPPSYFNRVHLTKPERARFREKLATLTLATKEDFDAEVRVHKDANWLWD
jgi:hypothetical protein